MSRPKGKWTSSNPDKANIRRIYTTTVKQLRKQYLYGNLKEEGKWLLDHRRELESEIAHAYYRRTGENVTAMIVSDATKTGTLAKETLRSSGHWKISYGRKINDLYKQALMNKTSSATQYVRASRDDYTTEENGRYYKEIKYNYDLSSIENFVSSLTGTGSLIALRIESRENRDNVLADYGY